MRKFPQKCQKIAGFRVLRERRLWIPTSDRLETWLIPSGTTRCRQCESTMVWGNLPLYHLYKCLLTLCHNLSFVRKDKTKYQKRWYGGKLRQTMVDSWYCQCLDWFVPEGISQVSRRSEVGNTKRRSLNTRLSSGTSAGTFSVSAGPYRNYHAKAGTKNEPWHVFGTISKKGLENRLSHFEPKNSWLSFSRGSGPPSRAAYIKT